MKTLRRESVLDLYNFALAVLLFVAPWLFKLSNGVARVEFWAEGAVIAAISIGAIIAYANWVEWANVALGVWLVVSPWLLGFTHTRAMHFSIAIGAAIAYFALIELWLQYDRTHFSESTTDDPQVHSPEQSPGRPPQT